MESERGANDADEDDNGGKADEADEACSVVICRACIADRQASINSAGISALSSYRGRSVDDGNDDDDDDIGIAVPWP